MSFCYAEERKKFDYIWQNLRKEYREAGMSEEAIQSLYEYDLAWLHSRRNYAAHTQELSEKTEYILECRIEEDFTESIGWMDSVKDERLLRLLKKLTLTDREILRLIATFGLTQREIAAHMGCSQSTVAKRLKAIRKLFC